MVPHLFPGQLPMAAQTVAVLEVLLLAAAGVPADRHLAPALLVELLAAVAAAGVVLEDLHLAPQVGLAAAVVALVVPVQLAAAVVLAGLRRGSQEVLVDHHTLPSQIRYLRLATAQVRLTFQQTKLGQPEA